jgi:hypothetical protein
MNEVRCKQIRVVAHRMGSLHFNELRKYVGTDQHVFDGESLTCI